jgi:hypothetical protein
VARAWQSWKVDGSAAAEAAHQGMWRKVEMIMAMAKSATASAAARPELQ